VLLETSHRRIFYLAREVEQIEDIVQDLHAGVPKRLVVHLAVIEHNLSEKLSCAFKIELTQLDDAFIEQDLVMQDFVGNIRKDIGIDVLLGVLYLAELESRVAEQSIQLICQVDISLGLVVVLHENMAVAHSVFNNYSSNDVFARLQLFRAEFQAFA